VFATGKLIAFTKHRSFFAASPDQLTDEPGWTLAQFGSINRLEADFVAGDLAELLNIAGWLTAIGKHVDASAGTRKRYVEQGV
jgi:hypothetical protein